MYMYICSTNTHVHAVTCTCTCSMYPLTVTLALIQNGTARSVCIALECFSALFPRTRPQKCHNLSHQFYLVLSRIIDRDEEIIHERLLESLPNILPSMTPFLSSQQVQVSHTCVYMYMYMHYCDLCTCTWSTITIL